MLGTHEINLIYLFRDKYQLLEREKSLIFRSIIADQYNYCPGWYWLDDSDKFDYKDKLAFHSLFDNNLIVRRECIELLARNAIASPSTVFPREEFLRKLLDTDNSTDVIKDAINYLGVTGTTDELPLLDKFLDNPEAENYAKALITNISIIARDNINKAFQLVLEKTGLQANDWAEIFEGKNDAIDENLLIKGLHHQNKYIRLLAAQELFRRNALSLESAKTLQNDDWVVIREPAFRDLIRKGEVIEPSEIKSSFKDSSLGIESAIFPNFISKSNPSVSADVILLELFSTYTKEQLTKLRYNIFKDGDVAYKALALKYFDEMEDRIIHDLQSGFKDLINEYAKQIKDQFNDAANDIISSLEGEMGEYITNQYIVAALSSLQEHKDNKFLNIARNYLNWNSTIVKYYALQLVNNLGNEEDVENVLRIARQAHAPGLKILAAKTALALSTNKVEILKEFLLSKDADLIKASLDTLVMQDREKLEESLTPLLYSDHDITRLCAVYYFVDKSNKENLIGLLETYVTNNIYYYDIVCWQDRAIYSPEELWPNFKAQLRSKVNRF